MNAHPTLSIITVNLNNREGLQRTIDSVVGQTFTGYEWIVIDGGSTDGSRELIEQYSDHFSYWCSEPDKGIYNAMNKGIAHAKGEWLQFLNSGDWLCQPTVLERVFSNEHDADILYGNGIYDSEGESIMRTYPKDISLTFIVNHSIHHQSSFYKRSLYEDELFNEQYKIISDYVFIINSILKGKKFEFVDVVIAHTEPGGISQSGYDEREKHNDILPLFIRRDVDYINNTISHNAYVSNHRILRLINNISLFIERRLKRLESRRLGEINAKK